MSPKITIEKLYQQFNESFGDGLTPLHLLTLEEANAWVKAGWLSPLLAQAFTGQILPIQYKGLMGL